MLRPHLGVFTGMTESIGPMWFQNQNQNPLAPGPRRRLPLVGPRVPVKGRDGRRAPCSSSAMSSGRLFLDRVARQQSPSPLHRQPEHKTLDRSPGRNYHRTVTASFPSCLTQGGHPIIGVHLCPSVAKNDLFTASCGSSSLLLLFLFARFRGFCSGDHLLCLLLGDEIVMGQLHRERSPALGHGG